MPPLMKQTLTWLEVKAQTASEVMEPKVSRGARLRIKVTEAVACKLTREDIIRPDVFVAKINVEIGKVQRPVLRKAEVDASSGRPPAPNPPAAIVECVRDCAAKTRVLVNSGGLAQLSQANRAAAGRKYHYPITQGMPDA
jgi:hypothetical protein